MLDCRPMRLRPARVVPARGAPVRVVPALLVAALLAAARPAAADAPLTFTLRTIDNDAGVRVVLEFTRKPLYEVRGDGRRVYVSLREEDVRPPFKKKDFDGALLERIKFATGLRTSEIVLYTGPEFGTFSSFEMGEPFRLVIDLRRRAAPAAAKRLDAPPPGSGAAAPGAPGAAPPQTAPQGQGPGAPPGAPGAVPVAPAPPGPAPAAAPRPGIYRIVVDPGHGGEEEGARGPTGLLEKEVTLDIARRLKTRLEGQSDTEVILTRESDQRVALDDRTAVANHLHAGLFVSVHCNSSRRDTARGSETYFLSLKATDDDARTVAALENNPLQLDQGVQAQSGLEMVLWDLAQSAYLKESSDLAEMIQNRLNETLGVRNRGIKQAPFRVLMGATMPAVLVEVAFISSPEEEQRLKEPAFKDQIAQAIAESIRRFREKLPK